MHKYRWLLGLLIITLAAAMLVAGCGNKKQSSSVVTANGSKGTKAPAGEGANTLGNLLKKQTGLSSYVMIMDMGETKMRMAQKLKNGKIVAIKMDMGPQGWMLQQMDKRMQYMYNPATKSAMALPISDSDTATSQGPDKDPLAALQAMVGAKVSSDTVDGVDCLKIANEGGTYWCEKQHGLPVQMDMGGKKMKFQYEKINSVPDSEFELPAGTKIQQIPGMPKAPK